MLSRRTLAPVLALAASVAFAGSAAAVQFPLPSVDTRLHTPDSGQPGAEWDTGPAGGDVLAYDSGTQNLHLDAEVFRLNYYDPNVGGCPTNVGSNCSHGFSPNLDITLDASLSGVTVTSLGSGFFDIKVEFTTTGGTDITVTDPFDSSSVLTADWASGTFDGQPTTGLTILGTYSDGTVLSAGLIGDLQIIGFAEITGGDYAQLFESGLPGANFGVQIGEIFDTASLNALAAYIVANNSLPSFSGEAQGQALRLEAGQFVPEPGPLALLGSAAVLLLGLRRRRA